MRILVVVALALFVPAGLAAEVFQVSWPTSHAAQPMRLQSGATDLLPIVRSAMQAMPESSVVSLALSQPAVLGLTPEQAQRLQPLVAERYRLMAQSPEYNKTSSALPYCFSERKPTTGLANVYVPAGATTNTPALVFLHGYGGSFLWYQHYLSENFPNHIIICPAYGISAATIPQAYVAGSLGAASKKIGLPISAPSLIGLSAGGFGACRVYVASPRSYSQLICLGAYPTDDTLSRFGRDSRARFLSGALEPFVVSGDLPRRINRIRRTCPAVQEAAIAGADHFFLLTHAKETLECLRRWLPAEPPVNHAASP